MMDETLMMPLMMLVSGLYSAQSSYAAPLPNLYPRMDSKTYSSSSGSNCTYNNGIKTCTVTKTQGIIIGVCIGVFALIVGAIVIWSMIRKRRANKGEYQEKLEGAEIKEKKSKKKKRSKSHGGGGHHGSGSASSHSSRGGSRSGSRSSSVSSRSSDHAGGQEDAVESKEEERADEGDTGDSGGGDTSNNNDE